MSWFTPPGGTGSDRTHSLTGARNMREHRKLKRERAWARQALEQARDNRWRLLTEPPAEVTPTKRKRKRKAKKNKASVSLAAYEAATGEWLDRTGPGVDF